MAERYFLVTITFEFGREYSCEETSSVDHYYIVNRAERKQLEKLDYYNEGACCGQNHCVECDGLKAYFSQFYRLSERELKLANYVSRGQLFSLEELLQKVDDQEDEDE